MGALPACLGPTKLAGPPQGLLPPALHTCPPRPHANSACAARFFKNIAKPTPLRADIRSTGIRPQHHMC
eukprot:908079-Alexandrium_andersonii.AAC.1